ncbi:hypothetical protein K2X33_09770 [bacterium]|nr:hypothetical protein [bacterium]
MLSQAKSRFLGRFYLSKQAVSSIAAKGSVWAFATLAVAGGLMPLLFQLTRTYPTNPWEAGITVEGARWAQGLPVYEPTTGHATHMYGWMQTAVLGVLFQILPVNNYACRWISLLAAVGGLIWLTRLIARKQDLHWQVFTFASLFSANSLADFYFTNGRMDMAAHFFGMAGVLLALHLRITADNSFRKWALTCLLFVVGVSFKQTAAVYAVLPVLFEVLPQQRRGKWFLPWVPGFVLLGYALVLKVFFPNVFEHMFVGFAQYPISWRRYGRILWWSMRGALFFWALLAIRVFQKDRPFQTEEKRWLIAMVWLTLTSALSYAKAAGSANSLMPYYIVMAATCCSLFKNTGLWERLDTRGAVIVLAASVLSVLQWFPSGPSTNRYYLAADLRQAAYTELVEYVSTLQGKVSSPEDPTITFFGTGKLTDNVYLERDMRGNWHDTPARIQEELNSADYVVDVVGWLRDEYVRPSILSAQGFIRQRSFGVYDVWERH